MVESTAMRTESTHIIEGLQRLKQIGAQINQLQPGQPADIEATLQHIVESAIVVVPDTSGVIYPYEARAGAFEARRVAAGRAVEAVTDDLPRPGGMGATAVRLGRRILSYEADGPGMHPEMQQAGAKVSACFPLQVADEPVGALYIYRHDDRHFTDLELLLLENFVNQAGMAIYHTRRMERRQHEIDQLREAGLLISSRKDMKDTLQAILDKALKLTHGQWGIFRLVDDSNRLVTAAVPTDYTLNIATEPLAIDDKSVMGTVALNKEAVLIKDLRKEPWRSRYHRLAHDRMMLSEVAVPLIDHWGRLEGVLNVESPELAAFTEEHQLLLEALATQAVIVTQQLRLLSTLQQITQAVMTKPQSAVFNELVGHAATLLNVDTAAIWLVEGDALVLQAANNDVLPVGTREPLHGSLIGEAAQRGVSIPVADLPSDTRISRPELVEARGWAWMLVVPVVTDEGDAPVGAFSVYDDKPAEGDSASDRLEKVLWILAHATALAVHNTRRQQALQAAQERSTLAETFAALGDVAANLLHRLNNKIGIIPPQVEGLRDHLRGGPLEEERISRKLSIIENSAREAMGIMAEELFLLQPLRITQVNLWACVEQATQETPLSPGVAVVPVGLEELPFVMAGHRSLVLVFSNLLENADTAMGGQGTITIQGRAHPDRVEITVHDTGPGIAPALQARIFEFSYSSGGVNQAGKLGFGLWWVKTLMARLGGGVRVESGPHQQGTTFHLWLPRVRR